MSIFWSSRPGRRWYKAVIKKLMIRLLLGRRKEVSEIVALRGKPYWIDIHLYEPADVFVERMKKALQEQGSRN